MISLLGTNFPVAYFMRASKPIFFLNDIILLLSSSVF